MLLKTKIFSLIGLVLPVAVEQTKKCHDQYQMKDWALDPLWGKPGSSMCFL